MATTNDLTIRIALDAEYDLHTAGYDKAEADDFTAAYRGCLKHIAERSGVDIRLVRVNDSYTGVQSHEAGTGSPVNADDHGLWQAIHDCLERTADEGWVWDEDKADAVADALRSDVAGDEEE